MLNLNGLIISIGLVVLLLIFIILVIYILHFTIYALIAKYLGIRTKPFELSKKNSNYKILVIGDSTAWGTGAHDPVFSIGGRLSQDFPNASISNISKNGIKIGKLNKMLKPFSEKKFDLIVLSIGGMDLIHFVPFWMIERNINNLFSVIKNMSNRCVFILSHSHITNRPFFIYPTNKILNYRAIKLNDMFNKISNNHGVKYLEIKFDNEDDMFLKDPKKYFAVDKIHPSSHGYGLWYEKIKKEL